MSATSLEKTIQQSIQDPKYLLNWCLQDLGNAATEMLPFATIYGVVGFGFGALLSLIDQTPHRHLQHKPSPLSQATNWAMGAAALAATFTGLDYMAKNNSVAPLVLGAAAYTAQNGVRRLGNLF